MEAPKMRLPVRLWARCRPSNKKKATIPPARSAATAKPSTGPNQSSARAAGMTTIKVIPATQSAAITIRAGWYIRSEAWTAAFRSSTSVSAWRAFWGVGFSMFMSASATDQPGRDEERDRPDQLADPKVVARLRRGPPPGADAYAADDCIPDVEHRDPAEIQEHAGAAVSPNTHGDQHQSDQADQHDREDHKPSGPTAPQVGQRADDTGGRQVDGGHAQQQPGKLMVCLVYSDRLPVCLGQCGFGFMCGGSRIAHAATL